MLSGVGEYEKKRGRSKIEFSMGEEKYNKTMNLPPCGYEDAATIKTTENAAALFEIRGM